MFDTKTVHKITTHISCSIAFFENRAVYEIPWKNIIEAGRSKMTLWRMRIACWTPDTTNALSKYAILFLFLLQQ
jgi:hypothetical protein